MPEMTLEDGTPIPKPARKATHRHNFTGARSAGAEISVSEVEFGKGVILLTATITSRDGNGWDWVVSEYLGGIVNLRLIQGWDIVSMDSRSAVLKRLHG